MKNFTKFALLFVFALGFPSMWASVSVNPEKAAQASALDELTLEEFLTLTPKQLEAQTGQKLSLVEKMAFKMTQKKIKKQVTKGAVDLSAPVASGKTLSTLALVFGATGLLLLFISGLLGLLLGIGGFVLGLIGSKKEGKNIMATLGIVFGALTLLLFLVAVAVVTSFVI